MIFVTVGACDLPFNRLVHAVDELVTSGAIEEDVVFQIGHSVAPTSGVQFEQFLPLDRMNDYADQARIIICQGGPGSILLGLARGKVPIVVPRQKQFGEQVDDHQVLFVRKLAEEKKVLAIYDTARLADAYLRYDKHIGGLAGSVGDSATQTAAFCDAVEALIIEYRAKTDQRGA